MPVAGLEELSEQEIIAERLIKMKVGSLSIEKENELSGEMDFVFLELLKFIEEFESTKNIPNLTLNVI